MEFIKDLKEKEYREFWRSTPNNHFMQSYEWGIIQHNNRNQIPEYVGLKDEKGNLKAAALLLKKKTPLNMCYYYSPRGYTMDFSDKKILKESYKSLYQK